MLSFAFILIFVLAYLLGSVSFAVVISRALGLADPRQYGSGNPGATNVLRGGHRWAAALTLLLDGGKGALAVLLAHAISDNGNLITAAAMGVFLGHLLPVFFHFKGGKGVATAGGILLALHWPLGLICALTWLGVAMVTRYSSLAALLSALAVPLYYELGALVSLWAGANAERRTLALIVLLLILRHARNIRNLLGGREDRIGAKKPPAPPPQS